MKLKEVFNQRKRDQIELELRSVERRWEWRAKAMEEEWGTQDLCDIYIYKNQDRMKRC